MKLPGSDDMDTPTSMSNGLHPSIPTSPPPSFRSQASFRNLRHTNSQASSSSIPDQILTDTFDVDGASDEEDDSRDDRQRLMRSSASRLETQQEREERHIQPESRLTVLPTSIAPRRDLNRTRGGDVAFSSFSASNDGVFANLDAKPDLGEKVEELPPVRMA